AELYLANLWLRSAGRILVRLGEVSARDFPALFQRLARLPWGRFVKPGTACEIRVVSHTSRLNHTGRIAEVCRDAIAKALGGEVGTAEPVQKIYLRFEDDRCQVSVDSSGDHLHRRGYRQAVVAAPLRETIAAGCLLACGYDGSMPLLDMMTGSGTIAIEAAMIALRKAPGKGRSFAFMEWPKYRPGLWQQQLSEAARQEKTTVAAPILAVDNNPKAIAAGQQNLVTIGLESSVQLSCGNMQELQPQFAQGLMVCNPPYGERLGRNASLKALYHDLGKIYGDTFGAWQGAIICPESELIKSTGVDFSPLLRFTNGGIKVALLQKKLLVCKLITVEKS
ncbi:MAG: hypothetical protein KAU22_03500, partial [Desulfuromonadales bacterium]|nr:hypothetical protein [Desulfuromonadales bacterium]